MTNELVSVSQTFLLRVTRPLRLGSGDKTRMVIGSLVSQRACDEVFLNGHVRLLDHEYHGKRVTKFT